MLGDPPEVGPDPLEVSASRVADLLETIAAELYRVRVAVEVMAGEALDRDLEPERAHPAGAGMSMRERAGAELRHLGRLEDLDPARWHDDYGTSE